MYICGESKGGSKESVTIFLWRLYYTWCDLRSCINCGLYIKAFGSILLLGKLRPFCNSCPYCTCVHRTAFGWP